MGQVPRCNSSTWARRPSKSCWITFLARIEDAVHFHKVAPMNWLRFQQGIFETLVARDIAPLVDSAI